MFRSYRDSSRHHEVGHADCSDVVEAEPPRRKIDNRLRLLASLFLTIPLCLTSVLILSERAQVYISGGKVPEYRFSRCKNPQIRREWRSFSTLEKADYIRAVRCLLSKPSRIRLNGVLYDDYPYTHAHNAGFSHNAAPFLPWHRYFLHLYEKDLQTICAYNGSLPYWDWTLDWESLATSPVFSPISGFGGNGDPKSPESVGGGHCVTDGPFADLVLPFYHSEDHDHCLSRAFTDGGTQGQLLGDQVQPSVVEEILRQPDYQNFFVKLEKGPHNQIPNGIGGDFLKFTAPNDPVFFLHHSQLDRLWYLWQKADTQVRQFDYGGISEHGSKVLASLNDAMSMDGLAPAIHVFDMMDTEAGLLYYTY